MKNPSTSKPKTENAQATLDEINSQIQSLIQKRIGLAQPLKDRYAELRAELHGVETQIRELDAAWKPSPLKPKAEDKIKEVIAANGGPMSEAEIVKACGNVFTKWKVKQTLKKKFVADKDGKFSVKA